MRGQAETALAKKPIESTAAYYKPVPMTDDRNFLLSPAGGVELQKAILEELKQIRRLLETKTT